jgi:5-formyltetrahydrofolate cyclo-ligase
MVERQPGRRSAGEDDPAVAAKKALRRTLLAHRRRRDPQRKRTDDARRLDVLTVWLADLHPAVVAAYRSWPSEPDTAGVLAWCKGHGVRVLLPAASGWVEAVWDPPAGPPPVLAGDALARADAVLVPGLAGTPRGDRLGRGAGWYDRALAHVHTGVPICLLLYDDEVVPTLPVQPHDRPVDALATPCGVRAAIHR